MNVTYRTDKDILYVAIEGRVDASNAPVVDEKISAIKAENAGKHVVVDADKLEYISSAGLRVILKLRKEEPELAIINVSPEVYEVFDMTGFTDMVKVEKAYRRLSVDGCEFIAKGANGAVYRYDEETIVKTYFATDSLPEIQQERENARRAFVLGINTAIPYGIVRVGEGYGTVTELLNAESVTKLIRDNLDNLDVPVKHYINMLKSIHAINVERGELPDMKEIALEWANFVAPHLAAGEGEKLCRLVSDVPDCGTVLHGDYHTNNVMVQNGEPVLIDMDTLCAGHPIFELGSMYNAFVGFSEADPDTAMRFFGFTTKTGRRFWELSLRAYLGTDDEELCRSVENKAMIIGHTRMLRRAIRRPNEEDSAMRAEHSKKVLSELLSKVDSLDF